MKGARIEEMELGDLPAVLAIEVATFPVPWTFSNFLHEIQRNPFSCNRIVRAETGEVEAYANAWLVGEEIRINNVAVRVASRGRGYGEGLLRHVLDLGRRRGCRRATLEVRPSNRPARALYKKLGFRVVARRTGYYSDSGEDALVLQAEL